MEIPRPAEDKLELEFNFELNEVLYKELNYKDEKRKNWLNE